MLTTQPATSSNQTKIARHTLRPRFLGTASTIAAREAEKISFINFAEVLKKRLYKWGLNKDVRKGGLSLEDVAGRLQTLIGVYILQGYYAAKEHKHPYETNGRNAVVWLMTIAVTAWSKSEQFGVNTMLLNPIMKKKGTPVELPYFNDSMPKVAKWIQSGLDKIRMDAHYFDIIEKAGIKVSDAEKLAAQKGSKALWASSWLDSNRIEQIQNLAKKLEEDKPKLTAAEEAIRKSIPGFFKRVNIFNLTSTGLITLATMYLIGGVAMKIVNKVFTPLDNKAPGGKDDKGKDNKPAAAEPPKTASVPVAPRPAVSAMTSPMSAVRTPILPLPGLRPPMPPMMPPGLSPFVSPFITSSNLLNKPPIFPGQFVNQQGGLN